MAPSGQIKAAAREVRSFDTSAKRFVPTVYSIPERDYTSLQRFHERREGYFLFGSTLREPIP